MKCCFDGCQSVCMMPPPAVGLSFICALIECKGFYVKLFVTGPAAPEIGELCSVAAEEPTLRCPHGYVCRELSARDRRRRRAVVTASSFDDWENIPAWGLCEEGDICALPVEKGTCDGSEPRYYFDAETEMCRLFNYSGCHGNDNNFRTLDRCQTVCANIGGQMEELEQDADLFAEPPTPAYLETFNDPCLYHVCSGPGEVCRRDFAEGDSGEPTAKCTCSYDCPLLYEPVCASDGEQYDNECIMRQKMCRTKENLYIEYAGECADPCRTHQCPAGKRCRAKFGSREPYCECLASCDDDSIRPVCGHDGKWYSSLCWLHVAACRQNRTLVLAVGEAREKEVCGEAKTGFCPEVSEQPSGSCVQECTRDSDCGGNDKCCFTGCSHQCKKPVSEGVCEYDGKLYKHLELFSIGCMECSCHYGRLDCSVEACLPDDISSGHDDDE
ncbi:papilin-like [Oscarella lobularis]|uniref:papilin-like n=1 Tax=Oscarella lobularis TaxID=121494 RepID=UPI00331355DC